MHIAHLSLTNFRNYGRLELDLPLGTVLLHGANAQGKTNLLEAIYYLATTRSPHADQDSQLINWEAAKSEAPVIVGRLTANVITRQGERYIEMRLIQERNRNLRNGQRSFRRQALVDRRKVRLMDLLGNLRVVMFLPQDMQLVTGPPAGRRRYLDITICQIDPIYCRTLSNYNKVLEQRNALLKQLAEGQGSPDVLSIFNEKLVNLGTRVFTGRCAFLSEIGREAQRIHYEELTEGQESVRLSYLPRLEDNNSRRSADVKSLVETGDWMRDNQMDHETIRSRFSEAITSQQSMDISRGTTSVGPHRDDWRFWIDGRDLGSFGSRGQQRSALLALKMGEINWMLMKTDEAPILLLDEVLAELDERRRELLLECVQQSTQAILTATDPGMFNVDFMRQTVSMKVSDGCVETDDLDLSQHR